MSGKYEVKTWDKELTKEEILDKGISHTTFQRALEEGWIVEVGDDE